MPHLILHFYFNTYLLLIKIACGSGRDCVYLAARGTSCYSFVVILLLFSVVFFLLFLSLLFQLCTNFFLGWSVVGADNAEIRLNKLHGVAAREKCHVDMTCLDLEPDLAPNLGSAEADWETVRTGLLQHAPNGYPL